MKISCERFVDRNGNVVPLQRRNEREAVSLTEKRRFTMSEKPYLSETDRVMTKGATFGALRERTNL